MRHGRYILCVKGGEEYTVTRTYCAISWLLRSSGSEWKFSFGLNPPFHFFVISLQTFVYPFFCISFFISQFETSRCDA